MTHTPGPWRIGNKHRDGSYAIHGKTASIIHAIPMSSSFKSADDNARLIAAAPDLLEALRAIVSMEGTDQITDYVFAENCIAIARAAIAKATGEK